MTDRAEIISRIQALRARAGDAASSEAEAEAAARIAARIIAEHQVTETELIDRGVSGVTMAEHNSSRKRRHPALVCCAFQIGQLTECRAMRRDGCEIWVGQPEDVAFAIYLCEVIQAASERAYHHHRNALGMTPRPSYRTDFMSGFGSEVGRRLQRMADERKAATFAAQGTDLVVVKSALIKDFVSTTLGPIRKGRRRPLGRRMNVRAVIAGQAAGDEINLSRPVEADQPGHDFIGSAP